MRKFNGQASSRVGKPTATSPGTSTGGGPPAEGHQRLRTLEGGLRIRGTVSRRSKRSLGEDLERVSYTITSENGTHIVEAFATPGGDYLPLGELVDLEVEAKIFVDRKGVPHHALRVLSRSGEF
jgi:hypothetical protein